jgi:hypothetical protein
VCEVLRGKFFFIRFCVCEKSNANSMNIISVGREVMFVERR